MIINENNEIFISEINALPALSPDGPITKALAPLEISFAQFLDAIVEEVSDRKQGLV